jgi:hypothetical protein
MAGAAPAVKATGVDWTDHHILTKCFLAHHNFYRNIFKMYFGHKRSKQNQLASGDPISSAWARAIAGYPALQSSHLIPEIYNGLLRSYKA